MHRRSHGSLFRRIRNGKPEAVWSISYRANGRRITEHTLLTPYENDEEL